MKKMFLYLFVILVGNGFTGYSQPSTNEYAKYIENILIKTKAFTFEMEHDWDFRRTTQSAFNSNKEYIWGLYSNGSRVGYFIDKNACENKKRSLDERLRNYIESLIQDAPKEIQSYLRTAMKPHINTMQNNIQLNCKDRERNPNYGKSSSLEGNNAIQPNVNSQTTGNSAESFYAQPSKQDKNENKVLALQIGGNGEGTKVPSDLAVEVKVTKDELEELGFPSKMDVKIESYVKKMFRGDTQLDLCSFIYASFADLNGYSIGQIGYLSEAKKEELNKFVEKYVKKANEIYDNEFNEWKENLKTPDWETIYNSIKNPQRFASIISQAGARNNDHLPLPLASDSKNYYFYLEGKNELMRIPIDGSSFTFSPLGNADINNDILKTSRSHGGSASINDNINLYAVQYSLNESGSCSSFNVLQGNASTKVGTGVSYEKNIIDIKRINSPRLNFSNEKTAYIDIKNMHIYLSGEVSSSTPYLSALANDNEVTITAGGGELIKAEVSSTYDIRSGKVVENSFSIGVGSTTAGTDFSVGATVGEDKLGVKSSVSIGYATLSAEFGIKGFEQKDAAYIANQLPIEVEKKLYNDFFKRPDAINTLIYDTTKIPIAVGGGYVAEQPTRKLTVEEINAVRDKINADIDKKIEKKKGEKIASTYEPFKPCL